MNTTQTDPKKVKFILVVRNWPLMVLVRIRVFSKGACLKYGMLIVNFERLHGYKTY